MSIQHKTHILLPSFVFWDKIKGIYIILLPNPVGSHHILEIAYSKATLASEKCLPVKAC